MSSGASSGSSLAPNNSGSEDGLKALMERKRKRKQSNRESARRSRMRKQQHLDELMAQVSQLRKEKGDILAALDATTQQYLGVEADNSVLRTQMVELSTRLQSLNDILYCTNANNTSTAHWLFGDGPQFNDSFINPWTLVMNQPLMAPVDMFQYC